MDLTKQPPRRPSNLSVAGMVAVARMADKARAHVHETLGEFVYGENSGLDRSLLKFLGISADDFAEAASRYDDAGLSEWVRRTSEVTDADVRRFNEEYLGREPGDEAARERLKKRIETYAPGRTDIRKNYQGMELDDWGSFRVVDLTKRAPRSPYDRAIAGVYALARAADKARAQKAGKNGDYNYNCPIDKGVFTFLNISAEDFQEAAWNNPNDQELSDWVRARAKVGPAEVCHFNATIAANGPKTPEQKAYFDGLLADVAPGRSDVTTWFDLLDLDDEKSFDTVDLSRHAPRSPFDTSVGGLLCLARLIDKARAAKSGTLGDYFYGEDSGADKLLLGFLGVSAADLLDAVGTHKTDADLLAWLQKKSPRSEADIREANEKAIQMAPTTDERKARFKRTVERLDPARGDITTFLAMMLLDDRVTFARRTAGV